MDNIGIYGVLIIKVTDPCFRVLVFELVKKGDNIVWSYVENPGQKDFECVREAYNYAIALSKKEGLPFVGYRNSAVDSLGFYIGYPFYSMEFLR